MKNSIYYSFPLAASILLLPACERALPVAPEPSPHDTFFERLSLLCSQAFAGQLVSSDAVDEDMRGKNMVMHVENCEPSKIEIPFHVELDGGEWNRSRTWIITRSENGLVLKHRHLHEDGSPDDITNYGGASEFLGSETKQQFPVDQESVTLFNKHGLDQSVTNIWSLELSAPGDRVAMFAYQLNRAAPNQSRNFRVEFDLSSPIEVPPPAWGQ